MVSCFSFPQFMMYFGAEYLTQVSYHNSLCNLAYSNIEGLYWRGKWGNHEIILRQGDCFVNATKVCIRFGKMFDDWKIQNAALIDAVNGEMATENLFYYPYKPNECKSIQVVVEPGKDYGGIYVHPYLFPHLFSWLCTGAAIQMAQIVSKFYNDTFTENFESIKKNANDCKKRCVCAIKTEKDEPISKKAKKSEKRFNLRDWVSTRRSIGIIQLGPNPNKFDFYYICCKPRAMNPSIRKILKRHPESKVIYIQKYAMNGCKLLANLKRSEKLRTKINYFSSSLGCVELIEKIRAVSESCDKSEITNLIHSSEPYTLDTVMPPAIDN